MGKVTIIWLSVLLSLSIIFVGHAEGKVCLRSDVVTVVYSGVIFNSSSSDTLDANPSPIVPDIMIFTLTLDHAGEAYLARAAGNQRRMFGNGYAGHGSVSLDMCQGGFALCKQSELTIPILSSGSLSSTSPPGLILRL